jgi:hypothetical protein
MAKKNESSTFEVIGLDVRHATICIEGDTDLILNKMNASNERQLIAEDRKKQALWENQHKNRWEDVITAVHWRDGIPTSDTNRDCSEEMLLKMLQENAPCITAFGLKKSWGQAVVRNQIDAYSTKFDNAVNIIAPGGLIPITFTEWKVDTKLMSPKRGAPLTVRLNHFSGWKAEIPIQYTTNVYQIDGIASIIRCAGFGIGIGSGRTSGYGRYHITDIK